MDDAAHAHQGHMDRVRLNDGSSMPIRRPPDLDTTTWEATKRYIESNPGVADKMHSFKKDPEAMRKWLQMQAINEYYKRKLESDRVMQDRVAALEQDEELKHVFAAIRRGGLAAAQQYWQDESLMLKICERMGGVDGELQSVLREIDQTPVTMHEAARDGDLAAVQAYLQKGSQIDGQDLKGITALGYAIKEDHLNVVDFLLQSRSNLWAVDTQGNSALHYASGYGQERLVAHLLQLGALVTQRNQNDETPMQVATHNGHRAVLDILHQAAGGLRGAARGPPELLS